MIDDNCLLSWDFFLNFNSYLFIIINLSLPISQEITHGSSFKEMHKVFHKLK